MVALTSLVVVVKYEEIQFPKAVKHVYCALAVGFPGAGLCVLVVASHRFWSYLLRFTYFALDEITDDLVVEVFDRRPLDAFLHVFLLRKRPQYRPKQ